jgi:exodeoxyribonuclease III
MTIRIVSWNVENIAPWLDDGAFAEHVKQLGAPDVLCVQELKLRAQDTELVDKLRALVPGYACHVALPRDPRNVRFRGGRAYGVATFVREEHAAVTATPAWDREGRVVVVALPEQKLAIVNLYAVNGTSKPYLDPDTGAPSGDRHAYKQRFAEQLLDLGDELRATADVVLAGDWNVSQTALDVTPRLRTEEPHATARAKLVARFARDGWVDAFRAAHPAARAYTWFGRTRTGALDAARVDYIVVSAGLAPRVSEASILAARALRPRSDHAPIMIALD